MNKILAFIVVIIVLSSGCLGIISPPTNSPVTKVVAPEECTTSNLTQALECYIKQDWPILLNLSEKFNSSSKAQVIWDLLKWEGEYFEYDNEKKSSIILRPSEFLKRRKGVCTDYTVLTAGILLALNITPVYVLLIHFAETPIMHSAVAVKIDNTTFVLDQRLPPKDLGSYWVEFAKEGKIITEAEVYEVQKPGNVLYTGLLTVPDFRNEDYNPTYFDAYKLSKILVGMFKNKTLLFPREELRISIPPGFKERKVWIFRFNDLKVVYHPTFSKQYAEMILEEILSEEDVKEDVKKHRIFWIYTYWEDQDLVVKLFLGR
ncbi:transglutaminase-like domain-containing protein [Pyrococcus sp. ST04]|uniref:transglutaminase-like domain-containing protein n=1 Tax=Pyrococcus sp. ST04 TaxID=1183377 RepID=UPI0002605F28|nr:transglutaminase-like domain-containing protein [Pyrococcus sp. ST04]AFK22664.1 hypothetical protein Py04_1089 [Pyrococcus sp. ST04]